MFPSLTPDPRLLAIEDDPTLGAHLFQHLNGSGFEVTWCRDGEEGLAAARSGGYDLILMDIMLPGRDGLEILRQLRQEQALPVILMSALGAEQDRIAGFSQGADDEHDRAPLLTLLQRLGAEVESGERPSGAALCLLAPLGADVSAAARRFAVDPTRSLAIDVLSDLERHRCLMACPATRAELQQAARTLFARDGVGVTLIRDSAGFIVQRTLASIVNLACDIAQQGIASVEHIDLAVRLGLGYPLGPLEWGDRLGAGRVLRILERLHALSGDPRYRPSPWLRRRAQLSLSLRQPDSPLAS